MKNSVYQKLEIISERFEEVQALLSDPETISDQEKFRALSKEFSQLEKSKFFELLKSYKNKEITIGDILAEIHPIIFRFNNIIWWI